MFFVVACSSTVSRGPDWTRSPPRALLSGNRTSFASMAYDTSPLAWNPSSRKQIGLHHEGPGRRGFIGFIASSRGGAREKAWLAVPLRADSDASPEVLSYSASKNCCSTRVYCLIRSQCGARSSEVRKWRHSAGTACHTSTIRAQHSSASPTPRWSRSDTRPGCKSRNTSSQGIGARRPIKALPKEEE